jgi:hypothetical protein
MKIGILGSGVVAQSLAQGWSRHGHEVRIGTRDPQSKPELARYSPGTFAEVAADAEWVTLALDGSVTEDVVRGLAGDVAGKVVIDATNPLDHAAEQLRSFTGGDDSLGERVQKAAPDGRIVKAYNTVGNAFFVDPEIVGGPPTMLIAGNDDDAKAQVTHLLETTGWDVVDLGGIAASRYLEQLALTWVAYGVKAGTWSHAFKLLR